MGSEHSRSAQAHQDTYDKFQQVTNSPRQTLNRAELQMSQQMSKAETRMAASTASLRLDTESGMQDTLDFPFDGEESKREGLAGCINNLIRTDSVDVTNDPRIMSDSVIAHRISGFSNVVVAAMLLCTLAFSAVLVLTPGHGRAFSYFNLFALCGMLATTCMNLFCTVVVIQQSYLVNRISTSGAMGFEMAKSLYLNRSYVTLRHLAISCFFKSIPGFVIATALMVWDDVCPEGSITTTGILVSVIMTFASFTMFYVHRKQKVIFHEKLQRMQVYESPMRHHMEQELSGPHLRHGGLLAMSSD